MTGIKGTLRRMCRVGKSRGFLLMAGKRGQASLSAADYAFMPFIYAFLYLFNGLLTLLTIDLRIASIISDIIV